VQRILRFAEIGDGEPPLFRSVEDQSPVLYLISKPQCAGPPLRSGWQ